MSNTMFDEILVSVDTNQWSCQFCTYTNPLSVFPKCKLCGQQLSQSATGSLINSSSMNTNESSTTSMSLQVLNRQQNDESNAKKIFLNIKSYCRQAKTHFVDDQFLPSPRSVGNIDGTFEWFRISEITSSSSDNRFNWTVYSSPESSDIQQGRLGDCWLMAALALVTERPKMLEHIILTKQVNQEGVYLIRLCHNGLWKIIIVDDCFPCTEHKQLAFSKSNRRQLYVPLIEKACAKLFGSYSALTSGQTEEGLHILTGAPCVRINLNSETNILDQDIIWAKLLSACEARLLIGAATGCDDVSEEDYKRANIHSCHAFSILAACFLSHISMQFVLVRDPHAQTNYNEESITSSIRDQLNSTLSFSLPSGAFWISWPVFLKFFNSITISSYASDNYDVREVAQYTQSSAKPIPSFHFYVSKTSNFDISLIYHRKYRGSTLTHTQSFILCDVEYGLDRDIGKSVAILESRYGTFTHWTGSLSPGFYVLVPFSTGFWNEKYSDTERLYTLVTHSKIPIDIQLANEPATLLADCLIAAVSKENINKTTDADFNYYTAPEKCHFSMFIAENSSFTNYLNLDIDMTDSTCISSSRKSFITHDCIPPRHRQIIFLTEWTHERNQPARMNYLYQSSFVTNSNHSVPEINISENDFHSFRSF